LKTKPSRCRPAPARIRICVGAAARGVEIQGLYYPVNGLDFTPDYPLGVSNERTGSRQKISVQQGRLLICCPLDCPVSFEQTDAH
jgi:thiamine pyrophosphokinase